MTEQASPRIPAKGTPEYDLMVAALAAPTRQGKGSYSAQVPWKLITELRAAIDVMGIDWRKYHRSTGSRTGQEGRA
jgi:hypothetical protein